MDMYDMERRRDHRTHAFVPIKVQLEEMEEAIAAHLLDISASGAGIVTDSDGAPTVGDYLELEFKVPQRSDEDQEIFRHETGRVVTVRQTGQGLSRVGVRFVHSGSEEADVFDPLDTLSQHRKSMPIEALGGRFGTARHFQGLKRTPASVN